MNDYFKGFEIIFGIMILMSILGLWKVVDIAIWIFSHVSVVIR